jgi:hypothetical protein
MDRMEKRHRHHIVPRHLGGEDEVENIELLDPLKHAELHALRFLEGEDKWFCAMQEGWPLMDPRLQEEVIQRMSSHNVMKDPEVAARMVESMRANGVYDRHAERMRQDNPMKKPEVAAKVSAAHKGRVSPRKNAVLSEETKQKLREAATGYKHTEEAKAKMTASKTGKKRGSYKQWSEENKAAQSERMKEMWRKRREN